jgi:hypothetical protein
MLPVVTLLGAIIFAVMANMVATNGDGDEHCRAVGVRYIAHQMARWAARRLATPGSQPQRRPIRLS